MYRCRTSVRTPARPYRDVANEDEANERWIPADVCRRWLQSELAIGGNGGGSPRVYRCATAR
jgi:hypothetical protein